MAELWFKAKRYGWGWVPCAWQGWLVLVAYLVLTWIIFLPIDSAPYEAGEVIKNFIIPQLLITVLLIWVCYRKGEKPRWRWGSDPKSNNQSSPS